MNSTATLASQAKKASLFERAQIIRRYIEPTLTLPCRVVLSFAADRTYGWSKEWERTSIRQMVDGVWHRLSGECVHLGVGLSKNATASALKWLVESGYLIRRECDDKPGAYEYSINWEFILTMLPKPRKNKEAQGRSAIPRSRKASAKGEDGGNPVPREGTGCTMRGDRGVPREGTYKKDKGKGNKEGHKTSDERSTYHSEAKRGKGSGEVPESVAKRIARAKEISQNALERKASSGKARGSTLEAAWKAAVSREWPELRIVPWTGKDHGMAKNLFKYLGKDTITIMEWCVKNWHLVRKSKFPEKRGVAFPANPDFHFMFSFRRDFLEIYNDREFREKISSNKKAALIVTLRKLGWTEADAIAEVEDRTRHDARIEELERWEASLKERERQAQARTRYDENMNRGARVSEKDVRSRIAERRDRRRVREDDELPSTEGLADRFRSIKGYEE